MEVAGVAVRVDERRGRVVAIPVRGRVLRVTDLPLHRERRCTSAQRAVEARPQGLGARSLEFEL
eukprot:3688698-Alexandrium_andersonii.AAC.1